MRGVPPSRRAAPRALARNGRCLESLRGGSAMKIDIGNTAFMLICASLVMLMTPGLAFFYGGLVGRKSVLTVMIQSFISLSWTTVLWFVFGYSMCFGPTWHGII